MRACARCGDDIAGRHGNARYCGSCGVAAWVASLTCSRHVNKAVAAGELPRADSLACEDCGKPARVYDHRDYSEPLQVAALCGRCNVKRGPAMWRVEKPAQGAA